MRALIENSLRVQEAQLAVAVLDGLGGGEPTAAAVGGQGLDTSPAPG